MKKIAILGTVVILLSILIVAFFATRLSPSNLSPLSKCVWAPKVVIAHVKAGTTRADTEKLLQSLNLTLGDNPNLRFEPDVDFIPSSKDIGRKYIAEIQSIPQVEAVNFVGPLNISKQIYIRFKEGTTRDQIIRILSQLKITFTKEYDHIDPEIFINTSLGKEDYYINLLLKNYSQFLDAKRFLSCPLGGPLH